MSSAVASEPRLEKKAARLRGGSGGAKAPSIAASNAAKLKVVIRKLPPVMTEDEFKEHTAHWDGFDNIEFFSFVKGKVSEDRAKPFTYSRASIRFKNQEQILTMHEGLDGRIFTDSKGNQSRPQVEFAPFQKVPKKVQKNDARQGTIDQDPEYIAFLEILKSGAPLQAASTLPSVSATADGAAGSQPSEKPTSTPLIEYIRAQKALGATASNLDKSPAKKDKDGLSRREKRSGGKSKGGRSGADKERDRDKEKARAEKAVKIAVRVASAAAASRRAKNAPETPDTPTATKATSDTASKTSAPQQQAPAAAVGAASSGNSKPSRRERGNAAIAAAILQRDLGLGGPLQRKERRGGGQPPASGTPTEGPSRDAATTAVESISQPVVERAPSEHSQSSQQRQSRRSRQRNRGGGQKDSPSNADNLIPPKPISILKKEKTSTGLEASAPIAPPQILKREAPVAVNPTPATSVTPSSLAVPAPPAITGPTPHIAAAQHTQLPPQSPSGPKGGRGGRQSHRGGRGGNTVVVPIIKTANAASPGTGSNLKSPDITTPTASSPNPTTPSIPPIAPAGSARHSLANTGNIPPGPATSSGGIQGGRGGHFPNRGHRGGGFPPRGGGRGGRGRGGGMRGGGSSAGAD